MIQATHLTKWFGPTKAVDDLTFSVPKGEILGFLGPNGAGKSTTLRMLTGYIPPTAGSVTINGHDIIRDLERARASVGYLPESTPLYLEMRVEEYLHYRGRLMQMDRASRRKRIDVVCDRTGLAHNRRRVIGHLSKGNRQRVGLAQALLHDPPVLVLDEPTAGLDPTQITHFRDLIAELKGQHTIILSSHILPEIERTADRLMIIASGRVLASGTLAELRDSIHESSRLHVEVKAGTNAVRETLGGIKHVQNVTAEQQGDWCIASIESQQQRDVREAVGEAIVAKGWVAREIRFEGGTLEEFFIRVTRRAGGRQAGRPGPRAKRRVA